MVQVVKRQLDVAEFGVSAPAPGISCRVVGLEFENGFVIGNSQCVFAAVGIEGAPGC